MAKKSSVQVNITIPLEWKQSDIEMVAKARAWAVKAHAGQKDKAGKDYFKAHVTVVAEGVKGDPIAEAVAFLHDTVEDTSVTIEDIRTGFPKEVADAVSTLTHSKGIQQLLDGAVLCDVAPTITIFGVPVKNNSMIEVDNALAKIETNHGRVFITSSATIKESKPLDKSVVLPFRRDR